MGGCTQEDELKPIQTDEIQHGVSIVDTIEEAPEPKAVYLVSGEDMVLNAEELSRHPEVIVTDSFESLKSHADKESALWIDKNALDKIEPGWLQKEPQKKYQLVVVGYNNALYSFREKLDGFYIHGPKVDWESMSLEPGFSVWMLKEETASSKSSFMKGYDTVPDVQPILDITNMLLEGNYPV